MCWRSSIVTALAVTLLSTSPADAQDVDTSQNTQSAVQLPSPRSAFIKSLILPGWGQATIGAETRGAFFFGVQSTSWFMLFKTLGKLDMARNREGQMVAFAADSLRVVMKYDSLAAERLSDPVAFDDAVGENGRVRNARALVESRERHRQDWITYTLFFTLLSGVDAYVAAHLQDFPADISAGYDRGAVRLEARIPIGGRD